MTSTIPTIRPLAAAPLTDAPAPLLREVIGDVLRHVRKTRDRTLREISGESQVSLAYLSEIERGQKEASSEILGAVCGALGITLLQLVSAAQHQLSAIEAEHTATPAAPLALAA